MQVFDSNGPEVRIRGTAHQICEKYLALAKDAGGAGDIVLAESYLQHAEHYQRIINAWQEESRAYQPQPQSGDTGAQPHQPQPHTYDPRRAQDSDLALPASILGQKPEAQAEPGNEAAVRGGADTEILEDA